MIPLNRERQIVIALLVISLLGGTGIGYFLAPAKQVSAPQVYLGSLAERLGIRIVQTSDASGPPAYTPKPGDVLAFVVTGRSFGALARENQVVVIDTKTKDVIAYAEIPTGQYYSSHAMSLSPDAKKIYMMILTPIGSVRYDLGLTEKSATKIYEIDATTLKLSRVWEVGGSTHHSYIFKDKYVMVEDYGPAGFFWLDPTTDEVMGNLPPAGFSGWPYLAWPTPDGKYIYVTVQNKLRGMPGWVSIINTETMKEEAAIKVGVFPVWVTFTRDGTFAYVTNAGDGTVMKIDVKQSKVNATVTGLIGPYGETLSADETKLYVSDKGETTSGHGDTVTVIDTATLQVIKKIPVGLRPDHIYLSPDGKELWSVDNASQEVIIIDASTDQVVKRITTPNRGDPHSVIFVRYNEQGQGTVVKDHLEHPATGVSVPPKSGGAIGGGATSFSYTMENYEFLPKIVNRMAPSTAVKFTYTNLDTEAHNVVMQVVDQYTVLGVVGAGETKTYDWTTPAQTGHYLMICTFHPGMQIEISVENPQVTR